MKMKNSLSHLNLFFFFFFVIVFLLGFGRITQVEGSQRRESRQLVKARVIPDVLDFFVPSAKMKVSYEGIRVSNGLLIPPSDASKAPSVKISARRRSSVDLFTLIVADPDAPSPDNPIRREILHWLVVNIRRNGGPGEGEEVVAYVGPAPPEGVHRYVFSLYRQKKALRGVKAPPGRALFKTRGFAAANGLGRPVAALYFNSTKEASA